jgi:hypothetical protein
MPMIAARCAMFAVALFLAGLLSAPPAGAGPLAKTAASDGARSQVILVDGDWDDDWDDDDDGYRHRRYYRGYDRGYYDGDVYVRAPFTRVKRRGWRSTSVDAPFTSVRVRPHGVWVRAPFVNIYVPR